MNIAPKRVYLHSAKARRSRRELLREQRNEAGLTQAQVAERLGRYQTFIAEIESGQRRVTVVELLEYADAIGFEPASVIRRLAKVKNKGN